MQPKRALKEQPIGRRAISRILRYGILYPNAPCFSRPCLPCSPWHLWRWHHSLYRAWGIGPTRLAQQSVSALSDNKLRWQQLELHHRGVQQGDSVSLQPAKPSSKQIKGTTLEMKMTKKAFLSTIRLAAMKIQKNSHLVMKMTKLTMMLMKFHFWTARPTSFSERFPGSEELFASITE